MVKGFNVVSDSARVDEGLLVVKEEILGVRHQDINESGRNEPAVSVGN